jgi:hypothetical protein
MNAAAITKRLPRQAITRAIIVARAKGLKVQLNIFEPGWSVVLPNNNVYHAKTDTDMVSYVCGY